MTAGRISLTSSERVQLWESKFPAQSVAVCPGCRTILHKSGTWHAAHFKAVANGGTNQLEDMTPSCGRCNLGMATKDAPASWRNVSV